MSDEQFEGFTAEEESPASVPTDEEEQAAAEAEAAEVAEAEKENKANAAADDLRAALESSQ